MKPEIKKMWAEALRRGEHKQAKSALRYGEYFCCLGVLCDLHAKETGINWIDNCYLNSNMELPIEVSEWSGLNNQSPSVGGASLTYLNDTGTTFLEIADLIEKHL